MVLSAILIVIVAFAIFLRSAFRAIENDSHHYHN